MRIKLIVVSSFQICKLLEQLVLRGRSNFWFDTILEVGEESESVVKLNLERLIIDRRPSASNHLTRASFSILAELGLSLVFVHKLYLPNVFLWKFEFMAFANYLQPK